ncbi:DUF4305 domain-containing protein [Lentibacillus saliphilus]|uniref:DUF4305 domain-containing protein n=1 Tax=Lentibacillus saliphilus TaxID=2737028 RepID=UPI001C2FB756|nr:DUF4305 domain-containing protein [Lentibacillus saliphilus]
MRISPLANTIIYFILGSFFFYLALTVPGERFNAMTIALAVIAALDIGIGLRFLRTHLHAKNKKNS